MKTTKELLEEKISFNKEEILDVKWISKEELMNMADKELRDGKKGVNGIGARGKRNVIFL